MLLRVLIVEDSQDDATLLLRELRQSGHDVRFERVETPQAMRAALESQEWDVILSDYSMPRFSAPAALKLLQNSGLDIPFIIISGTVGEDAAVVAMKAGAHDFFAKDKLTRLAPAIQREMREAAERRARKQAEEALQRYTRRLEILHEIDRAILTSQTGDAVAGLALEYFLGQVPVLGATVVAFDFDSQQGHVFVSRIEEEGQVTVTRGLALVEWSPDEIAVLQQGIPYVIEDASTVTYLPPGLRELQKEGLRTFLRVPLLSQNELVGVLNLGGNSPADFTSEHKEIAREVGAQLAIAMQQARLREQIERHALELEQRVEERTAELRHTKERVEAILNNSSDAILLLSFDGVIQQVNPAFGELFGYSIDDIFGHSLLVLVHQDDIELLLNTLSVTVNTGQPSRIDLCAVRKDNSLVDADFAIAAIREDGKLSGLVCSVRDITARKQMEAELRNALEKERELNELKSRFVSMVSHEFRTPLTTILSSSQLLRRYRDKLTEERQVGYLEKIETQVNRVTELLDDVLMLSRSEVMGLEFNPLPLDLKTYCRDLAEEIQVISGTTNPVVFSAHGRCTGFVGDEKLLRQLVTNLLTNAIKYSPEGGEVALDLICEDDQAVIRVQDTGMGIPEEDQKHLFEPFHRAKNVGGIQGTGLGLVIVKRAVEAHRGTITYESAIGKGTTFTVSLPINH